MEPLILTLCVGTLLAFLTLVLYHKEAQEGTTKGIGGFESHQIPLYPALTGVTVCIFLGCAAMAHAASTVLTDCSIAALILYCVLYFAVYKSLQSKRSKISRIPEGTAVTAADDFKKNKRDLSGNTAVGTVLLDGERYRAVIVTKKMKGLPKNGEKLQVEDTDEFTLLVEKRS